MSNGIKNVVNPYSGNLKSHGSCVTPKLKDYPSVYVADYEVRTTEQVVEDGRIVKKSVIKLVHPQDKFNGLNAMDFALENVISVGALDSLRECRISGDTLSVTDKVEGSVDAIIAAVDAAESNVESNVES